MSDILTLTLNPALDVSAKVPAVVPESKLRLEEVTYEPGGGAVNVARAIHKLGGSAHALFPAGGGTGRKIAELLALEGVGAAALSIQGTSRESLTVSETTTDRQFRFVLPGPTLRDVEWKECLQALGAQASPPEVIVFSGSLPPGVPEDFAAQVVTVGRELGSKVLVDTSGEALARAAISGAYLIKPNLREFLALTGTTEHTDGSLVQSARRLLARSSTGAIAISLGVGGAMLVTRDEALRFASPVVPIRSRVGAGDSMLAGIALALDRGQSLEDATRFGVACGAAAVMTPGSELCRREDAEALYDEIRQQSATSFPEGRRE